MWEKNIDKLHQWKLGWNSTLRSVGFGDPTSLRGSWWPLSQTRHGRNDKHWVIEAIPSKLAHSLLTLQQRNSWYLNLYIYIYIIIYISWYLIIYIYIYIYGNTYITLLLITNIDANNVWMYLYLYRWTYERDTSVCVLHIVSILYHVCEWWNLQCLKFV